jgi:hypothetical protein
MPGVHAQVQTPIATPVRASSAPQIPNALHLPRTHAPATILLYIRTLDCAPFIHAFMDREQSTAEQPLTAALTAAFHA